MNKSNKRKITKTISCLRISFKTITVFKMGSIINLKKRMVDQFKIFQEMGTHRINNNKMRVLRIIIKCKWPI